ncbi:LysR family transcriptional regulator [Vibrio sp. Hal054]|uniref:LysR family transcriptional regulator n=1 Tax=Vibrio sp. Hal054 TaxID=3035158 RepID=UPI00301C37BE
MINFDYNLLKVLSVLLETQNTTTTADKLTTSQPAISRSLKRLRELFADDLLVRSGGQMTLTPRAENLKTQLPEILGAINKLVDQSVRFDPSTETRNLNIAMNSSIGQWFAAPLAQHLSEKAPLINLTIEDWTETTTRKIDAGEIQFGINYFPMELPKHFVQRKGGRDHFGIVCSKKHPLANKVISLDDFTYYPFAVHIIKDWNEKEQHISRLLRPFNVEPRIQLRTTHLSVILDAIGKRDLLFPCSTHLIDQLDDRYTSIQMHESLPILEGHFGYVYGVKWRNELITQWLEETINTLMLSLGIQAN